MHAQHIHLDKLYTPHSATLRNKLHDKHSKKHWNEGRNPSHHSQSATGDFLLLLLHRPIVDRDVFTGDAGTAINAKPAIIGAGIPKISISIGSSVGTDDSVTWYVRMAEASLSSSSFSAGSILSWLSSIYFSTRDCLLDTSTQLASPRFSISRQFFQLGPMAEKMGVKLDDTFQYMQRWTIHKYDNCFPQCVLFCKSLPLLIVNTG